MTRRTAGVALLIMGSVILLAALLVPVPEFEDLERRVGTVDAAREDRISFCRPGSGDCLHTVVEVRHNTGRQTYNFAQSLVSDIAVGEPIALWVAPPIIGLPGARVWQAEQGGRRIIDYEHQARGDRRIMWILIPLAPVLFAAGYWLVRRQ